VQVPTTYDDGQALLDAAGQQRLEGIVSKRWSSAYHPGRRSRDWLKFPIRPTGSFVVGGFRHETDSDHRLGAVLVGEPTADGLVFRGRVGSGIAGKAGQRLGDLLRPLVRESSPFATALPRVDTVGTVWVEPEVVVDVQYLVLTTDGRLRQPAYRGVRTDLDVTDLIGRGEA
jgi:bifunctional non-homologous end joining protein LigD